MWDGAGCDPLATTERKKAKVLKCCFCRRMQKKSKILQISSRTGRRLFVCIKCYDWLENNIQRYCTRHKVLWNVKSGCPQCSSEGYLDGSGDINATERWFNDKQIETLKGCKDSAERH